MRLHEVVVTAAGREQQVKDAPASITVITRETLEQSPYRQITDALLDVPGVTITPGEGNSRDISIRGLGSAYTLILVDGKRMNSRESRTNGGNIGEGGLLPQAEMIERIEIVRGPMSSLYGVGVDDANDAVWVTQSRQNTVAVYRQSDLSLIRQFEPGMVPHARDVVIDAADSKAYATATFEPEVIAIQTTRRGERFSAASLSFDPAARRLHVVSNSTNEVAASTPPAAGPSSPVAGRARSR